MFLPPSLLPDSTQMPYIEKLPAEQLAVCLTAGHTLSGPSYCQNLPTYTSLESLGTTDYFLCHLTSSNSTGKLHY